MAAAAIAFFCFTRSTCLRMNDSIQNTADGPRGTCSARRIREIGFRFFESGALIRYSFLLPPRIRVARSAAGSWNRGSIKPINSSLRCVALACAINPVAILRIRCFPIIRAEHCICMGFISPMDKKPSTFHIEIYAVCYTCTDVLQMLFSRTLPILFSFIAIPISVSRSTRSLPAELNELIWLMFWI